MKVGWHDLLPIVQILSDGLSLTQLRTCYFNIFLMWARSDQCADESFGLSRGSSDLRRVVSRHQYMHINVARASLKVRDKWILRSKFGDAGDMFGDNLHVGCANMPGGSEQNQ